MSFEDNIADNKANCEGCPCLADCPEWVASGSKDCKSRLKAIKEGSK